MQSIILANGDRNTFAGEKRSFGFGIRKHHRRIAFSSISLSAMADVSPRFTLIALCRNAREGKLQCPECFGGAERRVRVQRVFFTDGIRGCNYLLTFVGRFL